MGSVRIYKEDNGDGFPWHARVGGCTEKSSILCEDFGMDHYNYCGDYIGYNGLIADLNDSRHYALGGYITK